MIDAKRFVLWGLLALIGSQLFLTWQHEHSSVDKKPTASSAVSAQQSQTSGIPTATNNKTASSVHTVLSSPAVIQTSGRTINVKTDVLDIAINTKAGTVTGAKLLDYSQKLHAKNDPVSLFNNKPGSVYVAQSGVIQASKNPFPQFKAAQSAYTLGATQKTLSVPLTTTTASGLVITKTFTFTHGSYLIQVNTSVKNASGKAQNLQFYQQLLRQHSAAAKHGLFHIGSYLGASVSNPQKKVYEKISFKKMQKESLDRQVTNGWVAMQEHYFLSAWIPPKGQVSQQYTRANPNSVFSVGMVSKLTTVQPHATVTHDGQLYVGPEVTGKLKQIAPGLNLTVDYGFLWFISVILFWGLQKIHLVVGNWGWAIILLTLLIKLVFYKPSAMSYKSMARMRELTPKLQALKERFGDDKQKLSQATMELYKKEKVNPVGGCLPQLIQIPVFIALYWVLLESVELRHAPFMFWIQDLSAADPYYILPILMGLSMLVQQKLNPPPPDPTQAKMMMFLPVVFTGLFLHFPAGLVLYWLVNNLASIGQQWQINRSIGA